ncbi:MAG TPA: methylated-DNA--[protein]-cysteine S-methyltransferase [Ktedonobacteraceae bacterium]|nr:methylated-DNA--[protein]-cysteine S-methyltransferase [Ktedonobacteraceae bacterium]
MSNIPQEVYWSHIEYNTWKLYLAATNEGLCCLTLPKESFNALEHWVTLHIPDAQLIENPEALDSYKKQVLEYLQGKRTTFTFPLDFRGTAFQVSVWRALTRIPYGETRSYSEIALVVQRPTAIRAVGAANGANPIPIVVPCHRVIGKNGNLTGYGGGLDVKEELLRLEGRS